MLFSYYVGKNYSSILIVFSPDKCVSEMHIISGFNLFLNCSLIIALLEVHSLTFYDIRRRVSLLEGWVLS